MKFRNLTMGLVLTVLTAGSLSAQTFDLGLEAGGNLTDLIGSGVSGSTTNGIKVGFAGGAFLCLNFGENFGIRPELLYEQKGNQNSGASTSTELDYLEIPLLLKFSLGTPVVNPGILLGPAFSFNVLAQSGGINLSNVNSSDVGLVGGVEVDISKFLVSGRYELGLTDLTTGGNVQNGTFTFLIGYSFI